MELNLTKITLDIPDESLEDLVGHLEKELANEYQKSVINKGKRIFPLGLQHLSLEGEEGCCDVIEGGENYRVTMNLPVFDLLGGYSSIQCSCSRDLFQLEPVRCSHMWLAQKVLLEGVVKRLAGLSGEQGELEAFFSCFENIQQQEPHQNNPSILRWQLDADFNIHVLKSSPSGLFRRLPWRKLLEDKSLWVETKVQPLLAFIRPTGQQGAVELDVFHLLKGLMDSDSELVDAEGNSLSLSPCEVALVGRTENDHLLVEPKFSNGASISFIAAGGGAIGQLGQEVYLCPLDQGQEQLFQSLLDHKVPVPLDQRDRLFQYLAKLDQKISISLDQVQVGEAADGRLVFRLTPYPSGAIAAELWVKPSPTSSYMVPGLGDESILDLSDPQNPKSRPRDLWQEQDLAQGVVHDLGLIRFSCQGGHRFILPHSEAALDVMDRLNQSPHRHFIILEWPKYGGLSLEGSLEIAANLDEQKIAVSVGEPQDWFQVRGEVEVDLQKVNLKDLLEAFKKQRSYIQLPSGKWAKITEAFREKIAELYELLEEDGDDLHISPTQVAELTRQEEEEAIHLKEASQSWWVLKKRASAIRVVDESLPSSFQAQLRPYQLEGFRWLNRLAVWGMGACLADDMGLGKTVQTLALLLKHQSKGPSLVVAPVSVATNWQRECQRFCPSLQVLIYQGKGRSQFLHQLMAGDILIVSYGLAWRDAEILAKVSWNCLVLDEAQSIKNASSKTAKAIQTLQSQWTLALSGTPIENHLGDLWSLFRTINPGLLGPWNRFKHAYALPISRDGNDSIRQRLEARIRPFILRRLKKDYLKELPPKTEITLDVHLSEEEQDIYQALRLEAVESMGKADDQPEAQKRLAILGALTRLRQAACHPHLVMESWYKSSSKLEVFVQLCQQIRENSHKALVFSQFTSHLSLIRQRLDSLNYTYGYLDGGTPSKQRQAQVDAFQRGGLDFFLISLKAGGTGITLTEADFVIHMDPWWNPAVEDQATDRAYRMGQKKPVTVYRLVSKGTVEEMILDVHRNKRDLAKSLLEKTGTIGGLSSGDLMSLIQGKNH